MSSPIRFRVRGRSADTDAPTVEELLSQVDDYFQILRDVEKALAEDGVTEIEWRVTDAGRNSPLALELTPFPRSHGVNIDARAQLVKEHTANGLALLQTRAERPSYFTEAALERAERLFQRVTDGLSLTEIEFGNDLPIVRISPSDARLAMANTLAVRKPAEKPYRELGCVEGTLQRVERDGYGRPLLYVRLRLDGETVKCVVSGEAQGEVEQHKIGEIWKSRRVRAFGMIYYKSLGRITRVDSDNIQFLRDRHELPSSDDIINEDFTGGMRSEEYLEKLRSGELS